MSSCSNVKKALFWGNFVDHCQKSRKQGNKAFHITMAALEFFPGVSQIVSLVELLLQPKKVTKHTIHASPAKTLPTKKTQTQATQRFSKSAPQANSQSEISQSSSSESSTSSKKDKTPTASPNSSSQSSPPAKAAVILGTLAPETHKLKGITHIKRDLYHQYSNNSNTEFMQAIVKNDIDKVKEFLSTSSKLDEMLNQKIDDLSPLELACSKGHLDLVVLFVESGAKNALAPSSRPGADPFYWNLIQPNTTALIEATKSRNIEVIEYLLEQGAQDCESIISLWKEAIKTGDLNIIQLLISYETEPADFSLSQAMYKAVQLEPSDPKYTKIIQFLLDQGVPDYCKYKSKLML